MSPTEGFEADESAPGVERLCAHCGRTYLLSLKRAEKIHPDSALNICDLCLDLIIAKVQMEELIKRVESGEPLQDPE